MDFLADILFDAIHFSGPIILCSLAGVYAYKADVINIGLDGMMLFGAFISALLIFFTGSYFLGLLGAVVLGVLLGLLFSYFGITRKANFIITGFAINLLAAAVGIYTLALMGYTSINVRPFTSEMLIRLHIPLIENIPFVGEIVSGHAIFTYVAFILIALMHVLMYHTKFGVHVRVSGESPDAARAIGISVHKVKYLAIILGGVLTGFAGFNVGVEQLAAFTPNLTAGTGFIAIAAIYCAGGSPLKASMYSILFGLMRSLAVNLSLIIGSVAGLLEVIPYVTIVVVLTTIALIRKKHTNVRSYAHE